ncbi:MBL fold metallo-hydrolase [Maritimibacter sp. 55A14]|uniref:MBL fold metallo-hydrolase n=1 Tax=Maritimibacter sp. 55A14 TaxID=2174844 RepID=UPI0011B22104|nr:MBL fold metallo-hydrolase [Maritimibacter sp. 55A14]
MTARISFLGAAREVIGSCYLIEAGEVRFLVACGMFQGGREAPARNRKPFDFKPKSVDFVLLTHAHTDHSGLLPTLTKAGFKAAPRHTFVVHGEGAAAMVLAEALRTKKGWTVTVPKPCASYSPGPRP